jgi:ATPase subunit of ABC transporter with duplicated ATPase domains
LVESIKPQIPEPVLEVARAEEATETPEPEIVEKAEDDPRIAALEAALAELEQRSASPRPPVLVTKAERDEFEGLMTSLTPQERMRVALAALHGENIS